MNLILSLAALVLVLAGLCLLAAIYERED